MKQKTKAIGTFRKVAVDCRSPKVWRGSQVEAAGKATDDERPTRPGPKVLTPKIVGFAVAPKP